MDIPHHITVDLSWQSLLWIWGSLHLLFFAVTHYHSTLQVNGYIKRENAKRKEPGPPLVGLDAPEMILRTIYRFFIGFEAFFGQLIVRTFLQVFLTLVLLRIPKLWSIRWHGTPGMMVQRL